MASHVNVTVVAGARRADLRIPARISVHRLLTELVAAEPALAVAVRKYQIAVPSKGLLLTEEDVIAQHPVTDGDVVEIVGGPRHAG